MHLSDQRKLVYAPIIRIFSPQINKPIQFLKMRKSIRKTIQDRIQRHLKSEREKYQINHHEIKNHEVFQCADILKMDNEH